MCRHAGVVPKVAGVEDPRRGGPVHARGRRVLRGPGCAGGGREGLGARDLEEDDHGSGAVVGIDEGHSNGKRTVPDDVRGIEGEGDDAGTVQSGKKVKLRGPGEQGGAVWNVDRRVRRRDEEVR